MQWWRYYTTVSIYIWKCAMTMTRQDCLHAKMDVWRWKSGVSEVAFLYFKFDSMFDSPKFIHFFQAWTGFDRSTSSDLSAAVPVGACHRSALGGLMWLQSQHASKMYRFAAAGWNKSGSLPEPDDGGFLFLFLFLFFLLLLLLLLLLLGWCNAIPRILNT